MFKAFASLRRLSPVAAAIFSSATVHAADIKIVPGSICQPAYLAYAQHLAYEHDGAVRVPSNSPYRNVQVTCPIIRDDAHATNGPTSAYVRVWDANDSDQVICTFFSCNSFGSVCTTETTGSGVIYRGHRSLNVDVDRSMPYGYYAVHCELPRNSSIYSIRVDE